MRVPKSIFRGICFLLFFGIFLLCPCTAGAQLTLNLVAVNASDQPKVVNVRQFLPRELSREDIIDVGSLKLDYDVDQGAYYVYGNMEFQPKESRTFKVAVKDVWMIDQEEIDILKKQLDDNLTLMKGKENYDIAVQAKEKLSAQLDYILAQQTNYSQNIERRIEEYRAYTSTLDDIRVKAFSLDFFQHEAKGALEEVEETKTIKLVLEIKNPSDKLEKTFQQKHYLPKEILTEHIVDAQGFEVRYDEEKRRSYLSKEEKFKPGEVKKYEIVIKDVWHLSAGRLEGLKARVDIALKEIQGTLYEDSGHYLVNRVNANIDQILNSQTEGQAIQEYIGAYRVNRKRYDSAEKDVQKLEQMLSIVRAKKLEELEKGKVKNILQKLKALSGLANLSEAVFKKGISVTNTWRYIFATIIFLVIFTAWHFIVWMQRSKVLGEGAGGLKPGETIKEVPKPTAPVKA